MPTGAQVPENHPLMVAWKAHQETEDYKNSMKWAAKDNKYLEGSMWALFLSGFNAGKADLAAKEEALRGKDEEIKNLKGKLEHYVSEHERRNALDTAMDKYNSRQAKRRNGIGMN